MKHLVSIALLAALTLAACGKKDEPGAASGGGASGSVAAPAAKDLADGVAAKGATWTRLERPYGSLEVPDGDAWAVVDDQVQGKDGTVIMLQAQSGVGPDAIDDYLASYDAVQQRDAPKYAAKATTKGTVGGHVAARVEGSFDNGTRFVTRDYLIFVNGKVVLLGARTPETNAAALPGVIDHVARSLRAK